MADDTLDRILDGALDAVSRHGLGKLEMRDVSARSGVSRGTVYRYFPGRDALLTQLAQREGLRFQRRMVAAIENAPPGPERILEAVRQATREVREHPVLQRLLDTDADFVLRALRREMPRLRAQFTALLGPLLEQTELVRAGVVTVEALVDWMLRLMISAFLLPESGREDMAEGLTAIFRMLTQAEARPRARRAPAPRRSRAPAPRARRERKR